MPNSEFRQKVIQEIRKIPFGQTITYQDLANNIQNPKAVRAVASAVASNKKFYIIPCHRVIRSDGQTGDYRWGKKLKKILLRSERLISNQKKKVLNFS